MDSLIIISCIVVGVLIVSNASATIIERFKIR
jgi:hypothetical protein